MKKVLSYHEFFYEKLGDDKFFSIADNKPYNMFFERPAMIEEFPDLKGLDVLDAGAAAGWYSEYMNKLGANVTAIDISENMLHLLRIRLGNQVNAIQCDLANGFPDYWKNGNCSCDFALFENDVLIKRLSVGFHEELGLCLTYEEFYDAIVRTVKNNETTIRLSEEYLALYKKSQLKKTVEIYNELYTSRGLLMPPELAWKGIHYFIQTGNKSPELKWITPDMIPDGGNWA